MTKEELDALPPITQMLWFMATTCAAMANQAEVIPTHLEDRALAYWPGNRISQRIIELRDQIIPPA